MANTSEQSYEISPPTPKKRLPIGLRVTALAGLAALLGTGAYVFWQQQTITTSVETSEADEFQESDDSGFGFNAQTEEYGDMIAMGIIDPAKVVRHALEDAASVAALLITTEAMVADKPAKEGAGGGMPDMGGMGGMGGMM